MKKIIVASDHAGRSKKFSAIKAIRELKLPYEDLSEKNTDTDDYPDFAKLVGLQVTSNKNTLGILLCGSGIGISIAANKIKGIRAALVHSEKEAELSRRHNDANILVLPGKYSNVRIKNVKGIIKTFYNTKFEGKRHKRRVKKIIEIEKNC